MFGCVGLPESTPALESESPVGRLDPDFKANLYDGIPPDTLDERSIEEIVAFVVALPRSVGETDIAGGSETTSVYSASMELDALSVTTSVNA